MIGALATTVVSFQKYQVPQCNEVAGFSMVDLQMDAIDPSEYVLNLAHSPETGMIAAVISNRNIALYNLHDGARQISSLNISDNIAQKSLYFESQGSLVGHDSIVTDVLFDVTSPHILFSSSDDRTLRCWDIRTGRSEFQLTHDAAVLSISVGCGGTMLATAADSAAHFFDIRRRQKVGVYGGGHIDQITQVKFNYQNSTEIATGGEDGLVCIYDTRRATADEALQAVLNPNCAVRRVGFFGKGGNGIFCLTGSETLSLWHKPTAQCVADWNDVRSDISKVDGVSGINYLVDCYYESSNERLYVAAGDAGGALTICEVSDTSVTPRAKFGWSTNDSDPRLQGHRSTVRSLLVCEHYILSGGEDARICAWPLSHCIDNCDFKTKVTTSFKTSHAKTVKHPRDQKPTPY